MWVKLPRGFETLHLVAQQKDSLEIRLARGDCRKLDPTMSIHHNELVRQCQSNQHLRDIKLNSLFVKIIKYIFIFEMSNLESNYLRHI